MNRAAALLLSATLAVATFGCSEPALDPAVVAAHRTRLELAEEPEGAQTVLEVRQIMLGETPEDEHAHDDHDHDGDGQPDHAAEDHVDEPAEPAAEPAEPTEPADPEHADDHDHDGDGQPDHAAAAHDHAEGEADHDHAGEDHDHADHDHADHDHAGEAAAAAGDAQKKPVLDELDVVLVGSVGGIQNPSEQTHPEFPFAKGQAVFFLADPEAVAAVEEHAHAHAEGEECAFCAAHAADAVHMLAVVQFTDEQGKTLAVDARDLFELKEKETVVVRGKAKVDPTGMLVVDANGLYVRR